MKADGGRMGYKDGEGVITIDDKIDEMISFYKDYLNQGGKMDFKTFSKKYIPENFADGGRIGYNNAGSVPGEQGSMGPVYTTNKIEDAAKEVVKRLIKLDGVDIPLTDKISMSLGPYLDQTEIRGVIDILGGELNFGGGLKGDDKGIGFSFRKEFQDGGMLVQPSDDGSRPGYAKSKKKYSYTNQFGTFESENAPPKVKSVYDNISPEMKKFYKNTTGKPGS